MAVLIEVRDTRHEAIFAQVHPRHHRIRAYLRPVLYRIGHMADQRALLRAHLAALNAEAAIDAVWPVAMRTGVDSDRPALADRNAQRSAALHQRFGWPAKWMWPVGIAMWIAPGKIGGACDGHLALQQLVIRLEVLIGDRPVGANAILRIDTEV